MEISEKQVLRGQRVFADEFEMEVVMAGTSNCMGFDNVLNRTAQLASHREGV